MENDSKPKRERGRPRRRDDTLTRPRSYTLTEPCHAAIAAYAKEHGLSASAALEHIVESVLAPFTACTPADPDPDLPARAARRA